MKPIHTQADQVFKQAMRCVQYRIPRLYSLRPIAFAHALGLRYGLIGMAACHHLMVSADPREEELLESDFLSWQDLVAEHVRFDVVATLPFDCLVAFPSVIGRFAAEPIYSYMTAQTHLLPFEYYLEIALKEYDTEHRRPAVKAWPWYLRRRGLREYHAANRDSLAFAQHFFERREADLEEVPEIVLLGE
jgi:hypothetical protein